MSRFERALISAAAVMVLLWFGWQLAIQSVVSNIRLGQQLQACEAKLPTAGK